jgi:hypothetical protein
VENHAHDKHDQCCRETDKNDGFAHQAVTVAGVIPWISELPE